MTLGNREIIDEYIAPMRKSVNNMYVEALAWHVLSGDTGTQFTNLPPDQLAGFRQKYPNISDIGLLSILGKMEDLANKNNMHPFENNIGLMLQYIGKWVKNEGTIRLDSLPDSDMQARLIALDQVFSTALKELQKSKKPQKAPESTSRVPPPFAHTPKKEASAPAKSTDQEVNLIQEKNKKILEILETRLSELKRPEQKENKASSSRKFLTSAKDTLTSADNRLNALQNIVDYIKNHDFIDGKIKSDEVISLDTVESRVKLHTPMSQKSKFDKGISPTTSGIGKLSGKESKYKTMKDEIARISAANSVEELNAVPKAKPRDKPNK